MILCGGAGRRMGGRDKPLQTWQGLPLIDHILTQLPDTPLFISANRNVDEYASRGRVITDQQSDLPAHVLANLQSPLLGIYAGLCACPTQWLLVTPGDTPRLPAQWWQEMFAAIEAGAKHAVAHDTRQQQHLHLLLEVADARSSLGAFLQQNLRQVHLWLQQIEPQAVYFDDEIRNLNTLEDLAD